MAEKRFSRRRFATARTVPVAALLVACRGRNGDNPGTTCSGTPQSVSGEAVSPVAKEVLDESIRLGFLVARTGPFASLGENLLRGLELALEDAGYSVAGRPIAVLVEDSAANPDQALTKARQLVERDRAHILAGITLSNEAAVLRDCVVEAGIPLIVSNAGLPGLTRDPHLRHPLIFRLSSANGQHEAPSGRYTYEELGYRRVALTGLDSSAGHDEVGVFARQFQAAGDQIAGEVYAPADTTDYGPYSQRLSHFSPDAIFAFYSGADAVRFVQQYSNFGLKERIPLFGSVIRWTRAFCLSRVKQRLVT